MSVNAGAIDREALLTALRGANLASVQFNAVDGVRSTGIRTNEDAAEVATATVLEFLSENETTWRKAFAAELRAAVGPIVRHKGAGGVFEFSPKGDSTEFWSYGNATAYTMAVIEVLRMLDPDMEFEPATTYHGGRNAPRKFSEALAEWWDAL